MWIYLIILIIAVILYSLSNETNERSNFILGVYLFGLALFVGCADMLGGYDRYIYGEVFDEISLQQLVGGDLELTAGFRLFESEWGYLWLNRLIGYLTPNRYIFIFVITIIIYTLLFVSIKKYCRNYTFAVIVFLGLWFFFTFTYLRQVMAATIGWLAIDYIIKRRPIQYFIIVFIAFIFHNSAIVLIPLYFIPIKKFDPVMIGFIMILCLGVGLTNVLSGLFAASDSIANEAKAVQNVNLIEEGSFRIEYLLEAILFLAIIFTMYDSFDDNNKKEILMLNMAFVFCAMLLLFIRSENGGRFAWNYMIGMIATITHIATNPVYKNHAITSGLIIMFCVLFLRIVILWGDLISPYKSFFTNGHREGDYIYNVYEYDTRYDTDKFYK